VKIALLTMLGLMPIVFVPASYGTQQDTLQIYRGLVTNAAFGQLHPIVQAGVSGRCRRWNDVGPTF
jgi:hypothetical protein